jgi:hypothetical protein
MKQKMLLTKAFGLPDVLGEVKVQWGVSLFLSPTQQLATFL